MQKQIIESQLHASNVAAVNGIYLVKLVADENPDQNQDDQDSPQDSPQTPEKTLAVNSPETGQIIFTDYFGGLLDGEMIINAATNMCTACLMCKYVYTI